MLLAAASQAQAPISIRQLPKTQTGNGQPATNNTNNTQPSSTDSQDTTDNMPKGIVFHTDLPDSVLSASVFAFRHDPYDVKIMEVVHPQFNPTAAQHSDPLDRHDGNFYLAGGGLGHPHIAVYQDFSGDLSLGFKPCIHPAYYKTPSSILFYQVQRPYTLLSYNSSLNKDYQIHVTHSQNINERWNVALDYHLFSPEGIYANNSAVGNLLDFNTNYYSRDARYLLRAGAIWQRFTLGENGGLTNDDEFIYKRISNPTGFPVASSTAFSRATDLTVFASQTYNTVRQVPWYREHMEFLADSANRIDTIIVTDTLYPATPKTLNTGLFGLDLQFDRHKYLGATITPTTVYDSIYSRLYSATLFWTNDAYLDHRWRNPLKVTIGVRPGIATATLDTAIYDTERFSYAVVYPFARVIVSPWQRSELSILAESGPIYGEYNLDAVLSIAFDTTECSRLQLRANINAATAEDLFYIQLRQKSLAAVNPGLATSDIPLTTAALAEAAYSYDDIVDLAVTANAVKHHHYFIKDASGSILPDWDRNDAFVPLLQGRLGLTTQAWGWFHFDMQQLLQFTTSDVIRVPLWASKNSLYADFHLFHRALRTQVGVDVRYHTPYLADAYEPSLGLFYRQNDIKVGGYLYADFFINLQIKRASIYVKAGHLNSLLESEAHYFTLPHYPGNPFGLFYGLTWQFFD